MMEMEWGGVRRERRVLIFFATKLLVCFAGARFGWRSKQQYANARPIGGRVWAARFAQRSRLPSTRLKAREGDLVGGSGKTSSCVCGLHDVARRGERDRKLANVRALPGGGGML